eukprot:COSAG02_NODE_10539_length_1918_cov_13.206157_1_plen_403_part_10
MVRSEQEETVSAQPKPRWESRVAPRGRSVVRSEQEETVSAQPKPRWQSRLAPQERSVVRSEQEETVPARQEQRWGSRLAPRERSVVRSEQDETVSAWQEPRWQSRVAPRDLAAQPDSRAKVAARQVMPQRAGGSRSQLESRLGRSISALERTLTPSEVDGATGNRSVASTSRPRLMLAPDDAESDGVAAFRDLPAARRPERLSLERGASRLSSQATVVGDTTRNSVASPDKTMLKSPPKMKAKEGTKAVERTSASARMSRPLEAVHTSPPRALEPVLVSPSQQTPERAAPSEMDFTRQIAALQAEIRQLKHENQELRLASHGTSTHSSDSRGGAAAELETLRVELDDSRSQLTQKDADLTHAKSQALAKECVVCTLRVLLALHATLSLITECHVVSKLSNEYG